MDTITTIKDNRIQVKAYKDLVELLEKNRKQLNEIPENIRKFLEKQSIKLSSNVEIIKEDSKAQKCHDINLKLLKDLLKESVKDIATKKTEVKKSANKIGEELHLYLSDLRWLSNFLAKLRKDQGLEVYLNELLETCDLNLPQNEVIKRNPVLEARCQRLREEQQNLEYRKMTKNVDAVLKHYPEDTVAYQSEYYYFLFCNIFVTLILCYSQSY